MLKQQLKSALTAVLIVAMGLGSFLASVGAFQNSRIMAEARATASASARPLETGAKGEDAIGAEPSMSEAKETAEESAPWGADAAAEGIEVLREGDVDGGTVLLADRAAVHELGGRDYVGQTVKEIGGKTYILIGNEQQLRAIGSNKPVIDKVFGSISHDVVHPGDADLAPGEDLQKKPISEVGHCGAGVDGSYDSQKAAQTGLEYAYDANYIIFRDIDLSGSPWQPLMFSGAIRDAKALFTGKAGQEIVVTYTAFINADAVVGQAVPNEAKVEYSNDPSKDTVGSSNPDVTHQYDFGFKLKKTDGTDPLAGAVFELRHEATGPAIELVQVREGVYRLAMDGDNGKVASVTTGATGIIEFHGLAAGDYYLVETKAPEGFNKLAKPVKITIADTTVDGTKPSWTVKVNDAVDAIAGAAGQLPEVVVKNNKGALLPETGGIGTVLFTLGGAALIGYGVYRKRSAKATA